MTNKGNEESIGIFISYARKDRRWFDVDDPHNLIPWLMDSLRKQNVIFWYDRELVASDLFTQRIHEEIDRAHIAVLMVSQSFLNSDYIEKHELPWIKQRVEQGGLAVVPVLVEPCSWEEDDFLSARQILPGKPTPLIKYVGSDALWADVKYELLEGIKKLIRRIRAEQERLRGQVPVLPEVIKAPLTAGVTQPRGAGETTDSADAVKWRKLAEKGTPWAQYNLGVCYAVGQGVARNAEEAINWYRKAAEQGNANAQYSLGECYDDGKGVKRDEAEAVVWYRKAAEQGDPLAQIKLGGAYSNGIGRAKDMAEAVKWFRKTADQGYPASQCFLGACYRNGEGVAKDEAEAVRWYRKAADQGSAEARAALDPSHVGNSLPDRKVARNDPCPCGSGKKFKECHGR